MGSVNQRQSNGAIVRLKSKGRGKNPRRVRSLNAQHAKDCELKPYMILFAEWVANYPGKLTDNHKKRKVAELARVPFENISRNFLRELEMREDWIAHREKFAASAVESARAKFEAGAPRTAELHSMTVDELHKRFSSPTGPSDADIRMVPQVVAPILQRVWPERGGTGQGSGVAIQININETQAELLEDALSEVEYEIIDPNNS